MKQFYNTLSGVCAGFTLIHLVDGRGWFSIIFAILSLILWELSGRWGFK